MKAVIVSSSYSYMERVDLLKECYEKKGYETKVLITDFIHVTKTHVTEQREDFVFVKTKPYKKNISVQRLYSHYKFAKDVMMLLEGMEMDLLHVLIPANSLAKEAGKFKVSHPNIKLCLDLIDLWPETMPISYFKNAYPFQVWRKMRDKNLKYADVIYCECDLFKKVLNKEDDNRFKTLYWVKKDARVDSFPQLRDDELHLCYLGSINNVIDIDYIVQMCKELNEHRKVILHIIGDGEKKRELIQKTTEVAKVIYHGVIYNQEEKQAIFDQCQFGLNIMKSSVCVGLTMKSLDYFQAGLPIINNIEGDTADMIEHYGIGFNNYKKYLSMIEKMTTNDYLSLRKNVKKLYEEKFTEEAFFGQIQ